EITDKLGLKTVPIIDTEYILNFDIDKLVELSKGQSIICPTIKREGLVFKSVDYVEDPVLGRLSFKAINPEFLIKYKE
ncbi:MAG: RNA ligase (ATP), partial [Clostridiales bacterium]|nr:RNA ligase (ATP) [Clostridiales bacterium]